jgi:hypothetical protein
MDTPPLAAWFLIQTVFLPIIARICDAGTAED